jgi:hypothetical protein
MSDETPESVTTAIEETIEELFGTSTPEEPEPVEPEAEAEAEAETEIEEMVSEVAGEIEEAISVDIGFLSEPADGGDAEEGEVERTKAGDVLICCHKLWKKGFISYQSNQDAECLENLRKHEDWLEQAKKAADD